MNYWAERNAKLQQEIMGQTIKSIQAQLQKYYGRVAEKVIEDFENVYNKVLLTKDNPTPADLYKLDKYWKALSTMEKELEKLGNREIKFLSNAFRATYINVYNNIALPSQESFATVDTEILNQAINSIWVGDGKQWSERVWDNQKRLSQTLNEELIHTLSTGRKTSDLKQILMERFNVSYHRAETLVRTETAHIQTEASKQRYKDYGIEYVEVLVDDDACPLCQALKGKKWKTTETPPLPVHPNEKCCLVPVIEGYTKEPKKRNKKK